MVFAALEMTITLFPNCLNVCLLSDPLAENLSAAPDSSRNGKS